MRPQHPRWLGEGATVPLHGVGACRPAAARAYRLSGACFCCPAAGCGARFGRLRTGHVDPAQLLAADPRYTMRRSSLLWAAACRLAPAVAAFLAIGASTTTSAQPYDPNACDAPGD